MTSSDAESDSKTIIIIIREIIHQNNKYNVQTIFNNKVHAKI